jgi:Tol biopolymer transport system component
VLLALGSVGCGQNGSSGRQILFLSDRDGDWALYAMDANGGSEHRVLPAGRADPFGEGLGFGEPLVSPDGRQVLLSRHGITVATLATGSQKRIGAGEESSAAWSPDSKYVAFSGPEDEGLYVVDARGGVRQTLLRTSQVFEASWSSDRKWIAFARQIGYGPREVYAVHPDGSALMRLTGYAPRAGGLAWSRDGRLAFIGARGSEELSHLIVVDVRSRRVEIIQSRLGGGPVAWSPDGQTIAYASTIGRSDASAVYTVAADGSGRRRLTPLRAWYAEESPVWSPDGKSLLFVRVPFGGGAEREIPEVWTMRADGSHERQLTSAYPDGGDNLEPHWIRGAVHAEPAPQSREARRGQTIVLRVPFAVDGISAGGDHAAIAPVAYEMEREVKPTPPILLWRPGHGAPKRLIASECGGVHELVLAGNRLAFDCDQRYFDQIAQAVWVFDLRRRLPREVFYGEAGRSAADVRGLYVDNIVGGGGLLAFGTARANAQGVVLRRTLWLIDGFDSLALRSRPTTGEIVAVGGGRLAVVLAKARMAILRADGSLVRTIVLRRRVAPFGVDGKPPFLLADRDLLVLAHGRLENYDTVAGERRWERRISANAQLEATDGRFIVYTAGSTIHLLSAGKEETVQTGARLLRRLRYDVQRPLHAALTKQGLYYCFNVESDRRYPGRVVFV